MTAIALGEAMLKALGDKRGIERYGYCLPMDDCLCSVALCGWLSACPMIASPHMPTKAVSTSSI